MRVWERTGDMGFFISFFFFRQTRMWVTEKSRLSVSIEIGGEGRGDEGRTGGTFMKGNSLDKW